jgi:uncharacterized iron-regulated membrane protein
VNNVKGPVDDHFLKGLQYYYDKHYTAAKAEFETVVGLFDYHWRGKALIAECNTAIANGNDVPVSSGMGSEVLIGIVVVVIIIVAVVAAMLFMKRRKGKAVLPPPPPPRN